jgi:hypothetical protein
VAERLDLERIVAERKAHPYRPEIVWYRIKSQTYTQGAGRWELFKQEALHEPKLEAGRSLPQLMRRSFGGYQLGAAIGSNCRTARRSWPR